MGGKEEQKKVDLQEIQAALERDRADLASKILSKLPSTSASSSSSSSKVSNPTSASKSSSTSNSTSGSNFIHRPANLGLGAPLPKQAATASNHSLQESRLKGRLLKGRYDPQNKSDHFHLSNGKSKRDQVEEKEEEQEVEQDSRSAAIIKKKSQSSKSTSNSKPNSNSDSIPNSKGKNKEEIKDPFSLPPPPISKKERKRQAKEALEESSFDGDSTMKSIDGETPLQGLTKSQRKKLKKKMKLTKEKEGDETELQPEGSRSMEMKIGKSGAYEMHGKDEEIEEESVKGKGKDLEKDKGKGKEIENPFALPGSSSKTPQSNSTSSKIQFLSPAPQQARDVGITNGTHHSESESGQGPEEEEDSDPSSSSSKAQILSASSSRTSLPTFQTSSSSTLTSSLSGAQFRTLNESLYTLPSSQAVEMVKNEPSLMEAYHQGFRDQTKKWPSKPVVIIAGKLREAQLETMVSSNERDEKKRAKEKEQDHRHPQHHPNLAANSKRMLEMKSQKKGRYSGNPLIVDLGCGEAPLARLLARPSKKSLDSKNTPLVLPPLKVLSYDLLSSQDGWVQAADVASEFGVPLPGKNVGIREKILIALSGNNSAIENDGPSTSLDAIQETKRKKRKRGNLLISSSKSIPSGSTDFSNHHESKTSSSGVNGETMDDSGAVCDVVVFCLCLMGTNWIQMIREGRRILQNGGELIIAEVTSRMTSTDDFIEIIESLGFQLGEKDLNSNTHFQLYSFIKLSPFEILSRNSKDNPSLVSEVRSLVGDHDQSSTPTASTSKAAEKLRKMDETREKEMIEKRGAVLKPCLYKRR